MLIIFEAMVRVIARDERQLQPSYSVPFVLSLFLRETLHKVGGFQLGRLAGGQVSNGRQADVRRLGRQPGMLRGRQAGRQPVRQACKKAVSSLSS